MTVVASKEIRWHGEDLKRGDVLDPQPEGRQRKTTH